MRSGVANSLVDGVFDQGMGKQVLAYCLDTGFMAHVAQASAENRSRAGRKSDVRDSMIEIPSCIIEAGIACRSSCKQALQQDQIYTHAGIWIYAELFDCLLEHSSGFEMLKAMASDLDRKAEENIIIYTLSKLRRAKSQKELEQLRSFEDLAMFFFTNDETLLLRAFDVRRRCPGGGPISSCEAEPGVASLANPVVEYCLNTGFMAQVAEMYGENRFCAEDKYYLRDAMIEVPTCILGCPYTGLVLDHEGRPTCGAVRERVLQQSQIYTDAGICSYAQIFDCLLARSNDFGMLKAKASVLGIESKADLIVYTLAKLRGGKNEQQLEQLRSFEDLAMFCFTADAKLLLRAFDVRKRRPSGGPIASSEADPSVASSNDDAAFLRDGLFVSVD